MKKFVYILMLLLCVGIVSCDDEANNDAMVVGVAERNADVTALGGTFTITLSAEADKVVSDQSWCVASISGKTVSLEVETNKGLEGRTALITVTKGISSTSIPITQPGNKIPVAENELVEFNAHGGEKEVIVENVLPFEVTVPADATWLNARVDKNKLILITENNYTLDLLSTTVKLISGDLESKLEVTQSGIVLIPEKTSVVMYNGGAEIKVMVNSTLPFEVASDSDWLTVTKDDNSVTLIAEDNSGNPARPAVVTLTSESLKATIDVTQRPTIYADYLGSWTMTGVDEKNNPISYDISITQATPGSTYKITGWGKSIVALDTEFAIQANFDTKNGLIFITAQENIGVFTDVDGTQFDVMFYGRIEMDGTVYYVGGSGYICYIGQMLSDGSVQWVNGQVNIGMGPMPVVGANYYGMYGEDAYTFKGDTPFIRMPNMIKATARTTRSILMHSGASCATQVESNKRLMIK